MKIVVIGSARTRSTVLVEMLCTIHPNLKCLYEFYTYNTQNTLENNTKLIHNNKEFILKILGHNINCEEDISKLQLESFDKIYLINRQNYFHQCCSLQVSASSKIWHNRNNNAFDKIKNLQYELKMSTVESIIKDVTNFCKIQTYLKNNKIDYEYYWYENLFELFNVPQKRIQAGNLDYEKIISNYKEYQHICDTMFRERFIYEDDITLK